MNSGEILAWIVFLPVGIFMWFAVMIAVFEAISILWEILTQVIVFIWEKLFILWKALTHD